MYYFMMSVDFLVERKQMTFQDRLLAELLKEHEQWIVTYHEHDSLLENKEEEELNEEERKAAWEDYENEKKGKTLPAPGISLPKFIDFIDIILFPPYISSKLQ